jgi:SAM-dependent methyltransferase
MAQHGLLQTIRRAEIDLLRRHFSPGARVLDLGGGDGYQASVMASWGVEVESIDVEGERSDRFFPVRAYDGSTIPFGDDVFDMIFSSNVLEHIRDLPRVFAELKRVARLGATHVHVLPSPKWRFWTNAAHYPYLFRRFVLKRGAGPFEISMPSSFGASVQQRGLLHSLKRALLAGPHGEYSSSVAELYYFSARRWRREFRRHGFGIVEQYPTGLFYTGYGLTPGLSVGARRRLASLLGSACNVFVLQ